MLVSFEGHVPDIHETVFVAANATVAGEVTIGPGSSVWFGAVLRGDEAPIFIGERSNVQDNATIHCDNGAPVFIGNDVTVGHNAILHSCTIGDGCVVGMGAIVLNGATIGEGCIVAAGAVVRAGTVVAPRTLVAGIPAEVKKALSDETVASNMANAAEYVRLGSVYRQPVRT
jgi:carbonic anhydrase/acetyltransferase-like protein (isoleucine patch superfamily)